MSANHGLGDAVELAVKPFAKALKLSCLDAAGHLRPDSRCARLRRRLNRAVKLPDWLFARETKL